MLRAGAISPAYRKPDTGRQHHAPSTGGMNEPHIIPPRLRDRLFAVLAVVLAVLLLPVAFVRHPGPAELACRWALGIRFPLEDLTGLTDEPVQFTSASRDPLQLLARVALPTLTPDPRPATSACTPLSELLRCCRFAVRTAVAMDVMRWDCRGPAEDPPGRQAGGAAFDRCPGRPGPGSGRSYRWGQFPQGPASAAPGPTDPPLWETITKPTRSKRSSITPGSAGQGLS